MTKAMAENQRIWGVAQWIGFTSIALLAIVLLIADAQLELLPGLFLQGLITYVCAVVLRTLRNKGKAHHLWQLNIESHQ